MNWYRKSQTDISPIEMGKEEYVGTFPTDNDDEGWKRDRGRKWDSEMQRAISEGRVSLEDAKKRQFYSQDKIKGLPQILYHTTTAKDAVISGGLKTRDELNMRSGLGLGGGASDTISFTTDLNVALDIKRSILEAKTIAEGQFTIPQMIEMAKTGRGATKPWLQETMSYWSSEDSNAGRERTEKTGAYPTWVNDTLRGVKTEYVLFPDSERVKKMMAEGWVQDVNNKFHFWKRLTNEEMVDRAFSFYKIWSTYRQHAGGPEDPMFFLSDSASLSKIPEDQIAVLEFRSKPGAMGHTMSGLKEWRIWSGNAVEFVREVT